MSSTSKLWREIWWVIHSTPAAYSGLITRGQSDLAGCRRPFF